MTILNKYNDILARIAQLTPDSQALWGTMTVNEMLVHLEIPIRHSLENNDIKDKSTFWSRTFTRFLVLKVISKLPKDAKAPREVNMRKNEAILSGFEVDRAKLYAILADFKTDTNQNTGATHPYFGIFNRNDWSRFHYLHIDHHLRQFGV